jgi:hypothetical protein
MTQPKLSWKKALDIISEEYDCWLAVEESEEFWGRVKLADIY